jgi:hypothetical protein
MCVLIVRSRKSLEVFFAQAVTANLIKFYCSRISIVFFEKIVLVCLQDIHILLLSAYANFLQ